MSLSKYCYPNSNVLRNKYNIKESALLERLEIQKVTIKLMGLSLYPNRVKATFDIQHLKELHFYLFGDIYEWAGNFRTENIYKSERVLSGASAEYSDYINIQSGLNEWFKIYNPDSLISSQHRTQLIIDALLLLWSIHPFREGNTRTTITFLWHYLLYLEIPFDVELLRHHPKYVRDALVMANYGEYKYLNDIMIDALTVSHHEEMGVANVAMEYATQYTISKDEYKSFSDKYLIKQSEDNFDE